jgi:hypothetical protein
MMAPSSAMKASVVVGSGGKSPRLMVARIDVCNFASRMGGAVRMLVMFFFPFNCVYVACGVVCDWVHLSLSLARCLRRMALFVSVRTSLLTVFGQNMLRVFFVAGVNGAFVGKRLAAIRSPSARRS